MQIRPDISACTVFSGRPDSLTKLLHSLAGNEDPVFLETLVVDMIGDGILDPVERAFPKTKFYECDRTSFVKALNQAVKLTSGRYILLCDDDVVFAERCLLHLIRFMDDNPDVGISGPSVLDENNHLEPTARKFPTIPYFIARFTGFNLFLPDNPVLKKHLMTAHNHTRDLEADWLVGSCVLIRREVVEEAGLLNEWYSYFYDADLCRRANKIGWHTFFVPEAQVHHHAQKRYNPLNFVSSPLNPSNSLTTFFSQMWESLLFLLRRPFL